MPVYLVLKRGVYLQDIGGVFSDFEKAFIALQNLKSKEPDNYHYFNIVKFEIDNESSIAKYNESSLETIKPIYTTLDNL